MPRQPGLKLHHGRKAYAGTVPSHSRSQRGTGGGERRWQPMEIHGVVIVILTILSLLASRSR